MRPRHLQDAYQQYPLAAQEKILQFRCEEFLPEHAHGALRVHEDPTFPHTGRNHNRIFFKNKVHRDGAIYIEIRKGMYGLPQAGMLANKLLKRRLAKHGYYEVRHTPGYWRHVWRPIDFTLVVDDFGVGYDGNEHALHLLQTLRLYYEAVSVDWTGKLYCGITLKWDYLKRTCELSIP